MLFRSPPLSFPPFLQLFVSCGYNGLVPFSPQSMARGQICSFQWSCVFVFFLRIHWCDEPAVIPVVATNVPADNVAFLRKVTNICSISPVLCISVYNNIMKTCDLAISSNYHLFKQGIKPMWEDPANKRGGKWSIQLPRNKTMSEIDNIWLFTVS